MKRFGILLGIIGCMVLYKPVQAFEAKLDYLKSIERNQQGQTRLIIQFSSKKSWADPSFLQLKGSDLFYELNVLIMVKVKNLFMKFHGVLKKRDETAFKHSTLIQTIAIALIILIPLLIIFFSFFICSSWYEALLKRGQPHLLTSKNMVYPI